jgi:hypothetical protein
MTTLPKPLLLIIAQKAHLLWCKRFPIKYVRRKHYISHSQIGSQFHSAKKALELQGKLIRRIKRIDTQRLGLVPPYTLKPLYEYYEYENDVRIFHIYEEDPWIDYFIPKWIDIFSIIETRIKLKNRIV